MESSPSTTTASAPFDKPNADVILRSSDNVDFHLHRVVLGLASDFFEDMFSLPHPLSEKGHDVHPETGLPLVHVTEDSRTLDRLMRLCYPVKDPILEDASTVGDVLKAATKYQLEDVIARSRGLLSAFTSKDPLLVYAIACSLQLEPEAAAAARAYVRKDPEIPLDSYIPEMDNMSAGSYYRLLRFRHIRRNGLALPKGFMFSRLQSTTQIVRDSIDDVTPEPEISAVSHPFAKPSDGGSDVVLRSSDGMLFYANKTILILASSVFADILKEPPSSGISISPPYGYPLPEDSQTISYLLQLSYPMEDPEIVDPCAMTTLSDAAVKYKMARATDYVKKWWKTNVHESTFETFSIAMKYDWSNLAKDAVAHGVTQVYDSYYPGMETVSAGIYRKYLQNRRRVRDSIWSFITKKRSGKGPAAQDKLQYWGHVSWESDLPKEFEWASTQTRRQESLQLYNAPAGFVEFCLCLKHAYEITSRHSCEDDILNNLPGDPKRLLLLIDASLHVYPLSD
ncbi:hypothetical protein AcV5_002272 [Taiwanofungus camphoratus]|nr:hypothetical protein AcV5_002272 [Antrodia cinnamomea]